MPGGDRTGPMGLGPMTGRGAGFCRGTGAPGTLNRGPGRVARGRGGFTPGMGRGFGGRGRGFRNRYWAQGEAAADLTAFTPASQSEVETLKEQAEHLEQSLGEIRKRLDELNVEEKKDNP